MPMVDRAEWQRTWPSMNSALFMGVIGGPEKEHPPRVGGPANRLTIESACARPGRGSLAVQNRSESVKRWESAPRARVVTGTGIVALRIGLEPQASGRQEPHGETDWKD